mgnify:CR=1 FL=1
MPELLNILFSDASLVSYWRMEGNSNDSKGSNNGTDTSITYSVNNGVYGQGAGFGGSSKISIANVAALNPANISFVAWIRATSLGNTFNSIESFEDTADGHTLLIKSNGKLGVFLDGASAVSYDGTGANTLVTGVWYHLAFTYDGTTLRGYVNGVQDGSATGTWSNAAVDTDPFLLGDSHFASRTFTGEIDDAAIFNRALSAGEIYDLFQAGDTGGIFILQ